MSSISFFGPNLLWTHLGSKHMVSQEVPKGRVREAGHNVIVWIHRPWLNALKMKASKEMFIDMEIFTLEPEHDFCWLFIFHQVTGGLKNWKSHHSSQASLYTTMWSCPLKNTKPDKLWCTYKLRQKFFRDQFQPNNLRRFFKKVQASGISLGFRMIFW